jgi:hypothetical protein
MTEQPLAEIRDYNSLHEAFRARANQLGVARTTIDTIGNLANGHASKILAAAKVRCLGRLSFGAMLFALGVKLVMIEDPESLVQITPHLTKRRSPVPVLAVKVGRGKHRLVSKRFLRKIASLGGIARKDRLNPSWRRGIARKAALARWGSG